MILSVVLENKALVKEHEIQLFTFLPDVRWSNQNAVYITSAKNSDWFCQDLIEIPTTCHNIPFPLLPIGEAKINIWQNSNFPIELLQFNPLVLILMNISSVLPFLIMTICQHKRHIPSVEARPTSHDIFMTVVVTMTHMLNTGGSICLEAI